MIIGRVGRPVEMRYTPGGAAVANFSLAVNRRWTPTDSTEAREDVEWVNVVAWSKLAETCNVLLTPGRLTYIEGRLQTRSWEGEDGQKKFRTEVVAGVMILLDNRPADRGPGPGANDSGELEPDDLPF
jgi:single-strand DNA-binding protein